MYSNLQLPSMQLLFRMFACADAWFEALHMATEMGSRDGDTGMGTLRLWVETLQPDPNANVAQAFPFCPTISLPLMRTQLSEQIHLV